MPSNRRQGEIARGLFEVLEGQPKGLLWAELLPRVRVRVPPNAAESAKPERSSYLGPWTTGLVKATWLVKNNGRWSVTDAGRAAYQALPDPEDLQREWNRLYHLATGGQAPIARSPRQTNGRPERTALQRALVGPAGEHYVLFRLYQQGMLASLAPPGAPTVDVLVLSPDETVIASVQVKTRTYGRDKGWMMGQKHEAIVQPRCFYAFVDLEPDTPVSYIVPSCVVADVLAKSHVSWLATPGRGGK